ncbi:ATP-binding protein [Runella aurantiaca]|uniref:ATP-binding protein n=1 Tax=Runella aurantiaca TaxID=2282308 RepID=A0A369I872_9BACT|nr:ATP-binding protein [Runella aurantiaca]RDB03354.1 ATP-binding protein [Runella aurantiaca]
MIERTLASRLTELLTKFPILSLTGPRQSGKTTLLRQLLPNYRYVSLENPDELDFALSDPRRFLDTYSGQVIFDEVQRAPKLFNYLQQRVDESRQMGQYILSGSQDFLLMKGITQSLAGRVAIFRLFPFSFGELQTVDLLATTPERAMFTGFYPPVFDRGLHPSDFYANYFETYVQRDVRELQAVQNLTLFRTFVRLAAGRVGQPINYQKLASDVGIAATTAREWLSILETSHLVFMLPSYYKNFSKRLIKSPKLYFYDVGLASYLLGIKQEEELITHHFRGNLFENMLAAELVKQGYNRNEPNELYFWQESNGHEIDILLEKSGGVLIGEIKSAGTINASFFDNLAWFQQQTDVPVLEAYLWYAGNESQIRRSATVMPWHQVGLIK